MRGWLNEPRPGERLDRQNDPKLPRRGPAQQNEPKLPARKSSSAERTQAANMRPDRQNEPKSPGRAHGRQAKAR